MKELASALESLKELVAKVNLMRRELKVSCIVANGIGIYHESHEERIESTSCIPSTLSPSQSPESHEERIESIFSLDDLVDLIKRIS